jgi:hypothetical protein
MIGDDVDDFALAPDAAVTSIVPAARMIRRWRS